MEVTLGIIFDMDGVIIDSNPYHKIAWTKFFKSKNVAVDDHHYSELIFGTTGDDAIVKILNKNYSEKELEYFNNEIDSEFREIIRGIKNLKPVKGLLKFLKSISGENFQIALATSAPPENIDLVLNLFRISKYFNIILDKNQVVKGKPDPEIYLKAVQKLGLPRENCIVFEDSVSGIVAARAAGLLVVGVTTSHPCNELVNAGASFCIKDFTEISVSDIEKKLLI